jgi:hypothetical protein
MAYPDPEVQYEPALAVNTKRRGPLRFEEGIATDTDVPRDFGVGAYVDTAVGRDNGWAPFTKSPGETTRERAHIGSSTWIEAPEHLSEFVQGVSADHVGYERVMGSERRFYRRNIAEVSE